MEIRNNTMLSRSAPVFQARVDKVLAEELRTEGAKISGKMLEKVEEQFNSVRNWGDESSIITTNIDLLDGTQNLSLLNDKISKSYAASLPQRKSNILASFLDLKRNDIQEAENTIAEKVLTNKIELIVKASQDDALAERIVGKVNPTDEEFAEAIDKMTDEEVTNFRFNMNDNCTDTYNLLNFVV